MKEEIVALIITISLTVGFIIGAIAHERDIYRCLTMYGESRSSTWTCDIQAREMKTMESKCQK